MNKKVKLGKVVKQIDGYRIRQMVQIKHRRGIGGQEISYKEPNGYFCVYAGKNLLHDENKYKSIKDAEDFLKNYIKKKKK